MIPGRFLALLALTTVGLVATSCQRNAEESARRDLQRQDLDVSPATAVAAARENNLNNILLLREAGLDLALPDDTGETPLLAAMRAGNMAIANNLLRGGVPEQALPPPLAAPDTMVAETTRPPGKKPPPTDPSIAVPPSVPGRGQTPLGWALARRDLNILQLLLDQDADPNQPLITPADEDFLQAVQHADFAYYLRRETNVTPLMLAAATGQLEAVRLLLAAGAKPGAQTGRHKTLAIWLAGKSQHHAVVQVLLGKSPRPEDQHTRVTVRLGEQKVLLYKNGVLADSSPISSGKKGFATPKGTFVVTNKYRDWKSTLYEDAPMPFFMRLSCGDFGLHAGALPGYPASHGCIRLPRDKAAAFFSKVDVGTLVEIVD